MAQFDLSVWKDDLIVQCDIPEPILTMKALNKLNPFLNYLGAFNTDNFRGSRKHILSGCWQALDVFITKSAQMLAIIAYFWYSLDQGFRIGSSGIPVFINAFQTFVASILSMINNRNIIAVIEHLNLCIEQRGVTYSLQTLEMYERIEIKHANITRIFFNMLRLSVAMTFVVAALQPISFIIFNYPEPMEWQLPVAMQ